jgi:uncharacterized protein YbjT (DUF2867 family)
MTILVTTPNGKVGGELVKQLLAKGAKVRIAAHTVESAKQRFPNTEVVPFDYGDVGSVQRALAGVSTVYLASPGDFPPEPEKRLIDEAKRAGVKRVVKLSVIGAEAAEGSPFREVEKHLEASGLEWTFLRPSWFMQNFTTSHAQSIAAGTLAEPAADSKTAFIDARDIAAVAVKALTEPGHAGKAYTLTGPELLDRAQVTATLSKVLGKPVKYVPLTDAQFREAVKPYLSPAYLELLSALYTMARAGGTERRTDDVSKVLGRPATSFEQFARDSRSAWS